MKPTVSRALLEVWEMKRRVYEETKDLSGPAYFRHMREEANRLFPGIHAKTVRPRRAAQEAAVARVAEDRDRYGTQ